jgi:hypothetical protein
LSIGVFWNLKRNILLLFLLTIWYVFIEFSYRWLRLVRVVSLLIILLLLLRGILILTLLILRKALLCARNRYNLSIITILLWINILRLKLLLLLILLSYRRTYHFLLNLQIRIWRITSRNIFSYQNHFILMLNLINSLILWIHINILIACLS